MHVSDLTTQWISQTGFDPAVATDQPGSKAVCSTGHATNGRQQDVSAHNSLFCYIPHYIHLRDFVKSLISKFTI
jgi:hypothetical protein